MPGRPGWAAPSDHGRPAPPNQKDPILCANCPTAATYRGSGGPRGSRFHTRPGMLRCGWTHRRSLTVRSGGRDTWGVNRDDEVKALGVVVDRLAERFPNLSRSSIEEAVREEHQALDGGRVRDFVPVLVEHAAKARLSG